MSDFRLWLAACAAVGLFAAVPHGPAQATMAARPLALAGTDSQLVVDAAQDGARFHGKRAQAMYCLKRNYWWFYRPYTTAPEDFPRCEPYFHYLEPVDGRRGARTERYIK
jgi:hypothetical protein